MHTYRILEFFPYFLGFWIFSVFFRILEIFSVFFANNFALCKIFRICLHSAKISVEFFANICGKILIPPL